MRIKTVFRQKANIPTNTIYVAHVHEINILRTNKSAVISMKHYS